LEYGGIKMTADKILQEANSYSDIIREERRTVHSCPEVGFDIPNTLKFVENELKDMGITPQRCGKSGLTALVGGKKKGGVFMLRADMDALPIEEKSGLEFSSHNGNAHACGHDMHTAMLLGAARILKNHEEEINGTVKLMFQPAEEIFEGSADMINSGLLENPTVDAAMMIHVMAAMPFESGTVVVSSGGVSAPAADYFEIEVQGKGCHGSMPNTGVDPINAAAHIILALQEINSRELGIGDRAALTVGRISAGTASNAIPDKAVMGGSIRTFDEEVRELIKQRVTEISESTAAAFRATAKVTYGSGCPVLVNDERLSRSAEKYIGELLGKKVFTTAQLSAMGGKSSKTAGSEDFAYVSHKVPSVMVALAAGQPEKGYGYPQHHPMVKFDENALPVGSGVFAYTAMRYLEENA
jgi:hippurate hydrolase